MGVAFISLMQKLLWFTRIIYKVCLTKMSKMSKTFRYFKAPLSQILAHMTLSWHLLYLHSSNSWVICFVLFNKVCGLWTLIAPADTKTINQAFWEGIWRILFLGLPDKDVLLTQVKDVVFHSIDMCGVCKWKYNCKGEVYLYVWLFCCRKEKELRHGNETLCSKVRGGEIAA